MATAGNVCTVETRNRTGAPWAAFLKLEVRRAFEGKLFLASMGIALAMGVGAGILSIRGYDKTLSFLEIGDLSEVYKGQFGLSAFKYWIPLPSYDSLPNLFFFVLPLLMGLAYAWSMRADIRSGYASLVMLNAPRWRFYLAKAIAAFLSGGTVIALPMVANFLVLTCVVPLNSPTVIEAISGGLWEYAFLSSMYYRTPMLYVAIRTLINFCLGGLWAGAVLGLSLLMRSIVAVVTLPYIGVVMIKNLSQSIYMAAQMPPYDGSLTILDHTRALGDVFSYSGWLLLADALFLLALAVLIPLACRGRDVL